MVYNNSATLIDNIFVNKIENAIVSRNIVSDISDHFSQFCINQPDKWQTKHQKKIRDFSHFSESGFNTDLAQINWNSIIANKRDNIDKLFTTFYEKVNNLTNKYAPLKLISKRMIKQFSKPWITKGIRRSIKIKKKLYHSADKNKYKLYRTKITILTRISKKSYFHEYFNNNLTNMRKTWEGINNLINRKRKNHKTITALRCPIKKEMIKNPKDIPDIQNKHFSTIGKKLASKLPNSNTHFSQYLNSHNYLNSFFFNPVIPSEVELEITSMPCNKADGLHSCPIRILKCIKQQISWPLAEIINLSIQTGVFPSKLKHAKVVPIYKTDDETDPGNYRPISLLSNFNQLFEKLMYKRLKLFFDKNETFYEKQYGFRAKHSTQHAIIDIVNNILENTCMQKPSPC
jgi:hypothetical protein